MECWHVCVQTSWLSSFSKQWGLIFNLVWFKPYGISFPLPFLSFTIGFIIFLIHFRDVSRLWLPTDPIISDFKKHVWEQMSPCLFFWDECNCCTSHIVYFHNIVLPFLMCVNCVDHFVSVTSWSHVWMSVQATCFVSEKLLTYNVLWFTTVPFECEEASVPVCVGMLRHDSLMGDCSLISLRFEYCLLNMSETFEQAAGQTRTPSLDAVLSNRWHLKCISSTVGELITLQKCYHWAPPIPHLHRIIYFE